MTAKDRPLTEPRCSGQDAPAPDYALASAFLESLRNSRSGALHADQSAARHFLTWLHKGRIPLSSVDETVVERFARHRGRCGRYRTRQLKTSAYLGRVRRFVCFLEERGHIHVVKDIECIDTHRADFARHLDTLGYSQVCRCSYRSEAEHLAVWLRLSRILWRDVDDAVIERFARHDCRCPIKRKRGRVVEGTGFARRRRGARGFIDFLRRRDAIPPVSAEPTFVEEPRLSAFRIWLKRHRGTTDETIRRYLQEASRWMSALGDDPAAFDAATIRAIVLDQAPSRSRASVRMTVTVLRVYLRFLSTQGECRPELIHAVPPAALRRLATLPRYASPETIERIIDSCDLSMPVGVRDRAILLLLARLGLRAGDVWRLRLADIDWADAVLCLHHGKNRQPTRLPLPQDAGDALLAYLTEARPSAREAHVFLRVQAPFRPFASASEIAGIVARAVARTGIEGVPTGSHLFRHSLATAMLRGGANLESVGTILRHRSPGTTAIYAKVDITMLKAVAQPWLGGEAC
jgi:site-specific recombinase XerD